MMNAGQRRVAARCGEILDMPIMVEELQPVVNRGTGNKASGHDVTGMDFFKRNWSTIKHYMLNMTNQLHSTCNIREQP